MAQARKAPPKPAGAAKPAAKPAARALATNVGSGGLRMTLWIALLAIITGAAPVALAGQALGYWRIPLSLPAPPFLPGPVVYDSPLAAAQPMVANAVIQVVSAPGASAVVATLQPGFPVQVTRYASVASVRWAQVRWDGPTKTAGGTGWAKAALLRTPVAGGAKPIGDLGSFSPALANGASAAGPGFVATLYFPASGYTYRTANTAQSITLGQQIVPVVLVSIYGMGLAAQQPASVTHDLASDNPEALIFDYHLVGGASGLGAYLAQRHITGFQFASVPAQSTATVEGLGLFYSALAGTALVSADDQRQIFQLLAAANANATTYASASWIGSGALIASTTQAAQGYATVVTGQLQPASGPAVVVVAVAASQPTAAQAQSALQAFFKPLTAALG